MAGHTASGVTVVKELYTETAHRLINYKGRCAHIHGHSWLWRVGVRIPWPTNPREYLADIPEAGMVMDFKHLKAEAVTILDPLDHALVLHEKDPLVELSGIVKLRNGNEIFAGTDGELGRVIILPFNPTSENLSLWVAMKLESQIRESGLLEGKGFSVSVECHETRSSRCVLE